MVVALIPVNFESVSIARMIFGTRLLSALLGACPVEDGEKRTAWVGANRE